jgi:hypothetical protein
MPIGVSAGRRRGANARQNFYGRAIEQKTVYHSIRAKHITLIKFDKKNRGLQWIIKSNNANINFF